MYLLWVIILSHRGRRRGVHRVNEESDHIQREVQPLDTANEYIHDFQQSRSS